MPCYDKKLEASREDFADKSTGVRDVDCVLTTGEVQKMVDERSFDLSRDSNDDVDMDDDEEESRFLPCLLSQPGSSSGGYLHSVIESIVQSLSPELVSTLQLKVRPVRGEDYVEYALCSVPTVSPSSSSSPSKVLFKGARCYGFRNLQNAVRKIGRERGIAVTKGAAGRAVSSRGGIVKRGRNLKKGGAEAESVVEEDRPIDFIEVMACPSGCVNGGGQIGPMAAAAMRKGRRKALTPDSGYGGPMDEEGMPEVDPYSRPEGAMDAKDWVAEVENAYWRIGVDGEEGGEGAVASEDGGDVHVSIVPYLAGASQGGEENGVRRRRRELEEELLRGLTGNGEREKRRNELWRTEYRAVQSDEVNGLAVQW
jgi:hypothetical protein